MKNTQRFMFFIDGTNLPIELGKEINLNIRAEKPPLSAFRLANLIISDITRHLNQDYIIRKYWFGSYQGDDDFGKTLRQTLRVYRFEPVIIKMR